MKKTVVLLILLCWYVGINAQQVNDPNAQPREAKNFSRIHVSNAFDVYLNQGGEEAVAVSASETKYRDRIRVEVKDQTLYISYDNEWKWSQGNKKLKAYISFKDIDQLSISGACDVFVAGTIKANKLDIHLSGASDLKGAGKDGGRFEVPELKVDLNGASDATITGIADNVDIEASGASDFKGFDLITNNCNAHATGASDIKITVNKTLTAHASGASDVHYKGEAVITDLKTSGASSVSKRGS